MRLVDADEIKKSSQGIVWEEWLDMRPTIDAVPVVRCPQCIHHEDNGYHFCNKWEHFLPDDSAFFCAFGERKEANMNKPLSEWTLGEVKAECEKHTAHCVGCPLWTDAAGCRLDTSCYRDNDPKQWDLSEPPRWTEQDKEDAKVIRHVISCRGLKYGRSAVTGKLYVIWYVSNNVCDIDAITDIGL